MSSNVTLMLSADQATYIHNQQIIKNICRHDESNIYSALIFTVTFVFVFLGIICEQFNMKQFHLKENYDPISSGGYEYWPHLRKLSVKYQGSNANGIGK